MKHWEAPLEQQLLAAEVAAAIEDSFLPKSNATNAYELLEDIIEAIKQEPKRYNQSTWHSTLRVGHIDAYQAPKCGTMACIAGWATIMKNKVPSEVIDTAVTAARLLGFEWEYERDSAGYIMSNSAHYESTRAVRHLFDEDLADYLEGDEEMSDDTEPGDPFYVELGIRKIRKFMATWEERLKAKVY